MHLLQSDQDLKEAYNVSIKNRFETLDQLTKTEDIWELMKDTISEPAKEHIPTTKRNDDKKWTKSEILDLMEEIRKAKGDEAKYEELDKMVKKKCDGANEIWISAQSEEIERNTHTNSKLMHKKI